MTTQQRPVSTYQEDPHTKLTMLNIRLGRISFELDCAKRLKKKYKKAVKEEQAKYDKIKAERDWLADQLGLP